VTGTDEMTKIVIRVEDPDGSVNVETPWATKVGDDLYRLENSPFYAYSVSWLDVVRAPYSDEEQRPTFVETVEKSGHRTVRIIFDPPVEEGNDSDKRLKDIVALGCSYEGANASYICVDIPPDIDFDRVRDYLVRHKLNFEHADPTYEELFGSDAD
jgi:hypothetical protein